MVPQNLRFAETHEWVSLEGDVATVGITKFAVEQLTDVVFVELAKLGKQFAAKAAFGQIESVKSVNDLYAPVAGEIIAKNDAVEKDPTLVSADPYGKGWMVKIKMASKIDYDKLLTPQQYETQIATQGH
ncbi:MAG: glycine cleavage system protein GcvH [Gemmataceae bacterium]|nr:glycine cleavage system protein GcvH [Gemmataceae bacterium]